MDAFEELKQDLIDGRIDPATILTFIVHLQQQLQAANQQLQAANQRIAHLEANQSPPPSSPTVKVDQPYSMRAEEKRQQQKHKHKKKKHKLSKKGRRGRLTTADKIKLAQRTEPCYPTGLPKEDCWLSHTRPVWRLENGQAILVAYEIFRGPKDAYGKIPGVLGRSEFGMEIVVQIAVLVYEVGLSFDKVCATLGFLQNLKLGKTQVDRLLHQLARHWRGEFEVLCTLLANSLVVHADETSWSINSVWALLSEKARVLLFGVHKDGATLQAILDPATFRGLVISDDYTVYANFSQAQKCWAHLLRKAIKLTLQDPDHLAYRGLTDELLDIYRQACRVQKDGRLSAQGRHQKVAELTERVWELCGDEPVSAAVTPEPEGPAKDFRLLVNEVLRLSLLGELFTFVTAEAVAQPNGQSQPVSGTNNEAERTLREPAAARDTGRANKTVVGACRQTIVVSVLESLSVYLPKFTLGGVVAEIMSWWQTGESCFRRLLKKMNLQVPEQSVLDKVLPIPNSS
jgi:transposase